MFVHQFNLQEIESRMRQGHVLFVQRTCGGDGRLVQRMRAIGHLAVNNYVPDAGDFLVRRGNKYPIDRPPLPTPSDLVLPPTDRRPRARLCRGCSSS